MCLNNSDFYQFDFANLAHIVFEIAVNSFHMSTWILCFTVNKKTPQFYIHLFFNSYFGLIQHFYSKTF